MSLTSRGTIPAPRRGYPAGGWSQAAREAELRAQKPRRLRRCVRVVPHIG